MIAQPMLGKRKLNCWKYRMRNVRFWSWTCFHIWLLLCWLSVLGHGDGATSGGCRGAAHGPFPLEDCKALSGGISRSGGLRVTTAAIWKMLQEIRPRGTIDMLLQWHRIARSSKGSTKNKASVEEHFNCKT